MIITNKLWSGEPIKATIKFAAGDYVVYSGEINVEGEVIETNNFIKSINFNLSNGNDSVNPLGIAESSTMSMEVFDENDYLSPMNSASIYYGQMVNGVEIKMEISYDGQNWGPYGSFYVTSWSGSFSDGYHNLVQISAQDALNAIGNKEVPALPVYANITIRTLIAYVMLGLGYTEDQYYVDPSLDYSLPYGLIAGTKVREFFNNICQLTLSRVTISKTGIIMFVPAYGLSQNYNEIVLTPDELGSLSNKNTSNIDYNEVVVKYLEMLGSSEETLLEDNSHSIDVGVTTITDLKFSKKALAIKNVNVICGNRNRLSSVVYAAYQNGIQVSIASTVQIDECKIVVRGIAASTKDREVKVPITNASLVGGRPFEFDTQLMMEEKDANNLARDIVQYIENISKQISVSGTVITPRVDVGDRVVIGGTGTLYDGTYKITNVSITMGEDYNCDLTLVRL